MAYNVLNKNRCIFEKIKIGKQEKEQKKRKREKKRAKNEKKLKNARN